jgi:NAD(P)-dependent dehydrogenase (short-subunit alcohol dehydrogenase family)
MATFLITGANSGIGYETAKALALRGDRVMMLCRNQQRGLVAQRDLIAETSNDAVDLFVCDLGDLREVATTAELIRRQTKRLDGVVANAGMFLKEREVTPDGYEKTVAASHLGHFLLVEELLPLLKATGTAHEPARVILVSSEAHRASHLKPGFTREDLLLPAKRYGGLKAYGNAKLANVLHAAELARRLEGAHVVANALHPGVVATNFGKGSLFGTLFKVFKPFLKKPEDGADTVIFLATDPDGARASGAYFRDRRAIAPSDEARSETLAQELWAMSEALVKEALAAR